ncbi:hypothetical protein E4T38_01497 [Aureobasidium subglaciale]|nr:hypothetical protein E4T38_01497 [Aureobasidium subglaciale]KAI5229673.1 hypothetical protein E4T40_01498 [Aureobasidium subglaciale]KAI5233408.1 hypothetical protein E4T41_01495 [Aureobasidium subglaciale]KAI5266567.1 hypothetical protein E4T46_01497 [Aureobasidium subglaciale]
MAPKKAAVVRTAASSRPRRTAKPTTTATTTSATAAKPKKKATTAVLKKAAYKKVAPKKAASKVTKKKPVAKKAANKKAATPSYVKFGYKTDGSNPLGPEADKKVRDKNIQKQLGKEKWNAIDARYTPKELSNLERTWRLNKHQMGDRWTMGLEDFHEREKEKDSVCWDEAHEKGIEKIREKYTDAEIQEMLKQMHKEQRLGWIPHVKTLDDYLFWQEIDNIKNLGNAIGKWDSYNKLQKGNR